MAFNFSHKIALIFVCAIAVSGCARPKDDNITAFASATGALTTFAKNTGDLNAEIDSKIKLALAAQDSIAGNAVVIGVPKGEFLTGRSDADWKAVTGFLDAISAYAAALAKANDPTLETGLGDKLTSIGSAIAKVNTALSLGGSSDRITAISGIVGQIVTVAANLYASYQIKDAMNQTQSTLDQGRPFLQDALAGVYRSSAVKLAEYKLILGCKTVLVAALPDSAGQDKSANTKEGCRIRYPKLAAAVISPSSSLQRYDNFIAASQEFAGLQVRVEALKDVSKAVGTMIDAHNKLKDDLDDKTALMDFLKSVGSIADGLAKVEGAKAS